jgi:hypothetical protein
MDLLVSPTSNSRLKASVIIVIQFGGGVEVENGYAIGR